MDKNKKIGLVSLIMMIFSSIFGFANMPVAFLQMGYASIIWYIFAAIFFFLPVAMMLAEYGATFKEEEGGIYSWLTHTLGEKWAFIGTFIWLSSWIIWLLSISSKVYIPFSAMLFGKDLTQTYPSYWFVGDFLDALSYFLCQPGCECDFEGFQYRGDFCQCHGSCLFSGNWHRLCC